MRYFVFLLLAAFNVSAFAAACKYYLMSDGVTLTTSASAACESHLPDLRKQYSNLSVEFAGTFGSPPSRCDFKVSGSNGHVYETPSKSLEYTTKECEDSVCKSKQGQDFTLNWTVGYTRSPDIDADPNWDLVAPPLKVPSDGMVCDPVSSCKVAMVLVPTGVWQSVSPTSQGLYRISLDFGAQHMGETCTPTPADTAGASPAADKPTCPGFVGEVNGVPGCYGTASNPTANDVPETKPKPPEAGNPPAGKKPDSGEGSGTGGAGRTPSTGDGGPAGGPAAAAGSGTKPDGTTPKPVEGKEQANCGAPGQSKCSIDETGTPNGADVKNKLIDDVNKAADQQKAEIEKAANLKADGWTFSFSLPSGCTALTLAGYQIPGQGPLSIDVCKWQPMIHDVMTMLWLICTVWGCINMVGSTQRSS